MLTGLLNRRAFDQRLEQEVARAHRDGQPLTLVLCDIEDFKRVNDELGHLVGDTVLKGVADRLREVALPTGAACRQGGDEFAVLLPGLTLEVATEFPSRLSDLFSPTQIRGLPDSAVSYGFAELEEGENSASLVKRADLDRWGSDPDPPTGVREPRRPRPPRGSAPARKPLNDDE
jgi:diguanylate cyclase (GGDEF)-like protein